MSALHPDLLTSETEGAIPVRFVGPDSAAEAAFGGWAEANDHLLSKTDAALEALQKTQYTQVPLPDLKDQFKASKYFTSAEWRAKYADGTVTKWLQQVTDFFVQAGNIANPLSAAQYFDPKPYLEVVKA